MTDAIHAHTLLRWAKRLRSGEEPIYPATRELFEPMKAAQLAQADRLEAKAKGLLKGVGG